MASVNLNRMKLKRMFRAISTIDVKLNKESRTLEFPFSSEYPVDRYFGKEILSHKSGAADLSRLNDGGAFLWNHNSDNVIGVVENAELRGDKRLWATVRFSKNEKAQEVMQDVEDGILRNVSFGYQIEEMELIKSGQQSGDEFLATKWLPFEVSMVSIPADPTVGLGRSDSDDEIDVRVIQSTKGEIKKMDELEKQKIEAERKTADIKIRELALAEERARMSAIDALAEKHGHSDLARQLKDSGKSIEEARSAFLEKIGSTQKPMTGNEGEIGLSEKEVRQFSMLRAINALSNPHDMAAQKAAAFEREVSIAAEKKAGKTARGLMIPFDVLRSAGKRDLTVGSATQAGNLVATDLQASSFIELLRNKMAVQRLGATSLNGLVGNIAIPRQSGAGTAYWVGENTAPTESMQTVGQVQMSPKTVGAYTDFSRKLMIQSSIDVENMVKTDLASVLALAIDYAALYGSGSANQPLGIFGSGINTVDFAAAAPTWAEIVQMESEVAADNADIGSLAYLFNARASGVLKTTVKESGQAIYIMQDGLVNGYKAEVSNQVKSLNTTEHDYFFGNWADLILGFWSGLDLMVDPYTGSKEGTVRIVAFQDMDVGVRHAESFCYGNKTIS